MKKFLALTVVFAALVMVGCAEQGGQNATPAENEAAPPVETPEEAPADAPADDTNP